jgi:hypothetical protein
MADKGWIFKYGRVPITFVCQDYLADVTSLRPSYLYSGPRFVPYSEPLLHPETSFAASSP